MNRGIGASDGSFREQALPEDTGRVRLGHDLKVATVRTNTWGHVPSGELVAEDRVVCICVELGPQCLVVERDEDIGGTDTTPSTASTRAAR